MNPLARTPERVIEDAGLTCIHAGATLNSVTVIPDETQRYRVVVEAVDQLETALRDIRLHARQLVTGNTPGHRRRPVDEHLLDRINSLRGEGDGPDRILNAAQEARHRINSLRGEDTP